MVAVLRQAGGAGGWHCSLPGQQCVVSRGVCLTDRIPATSEGLGVNVAMFKLSHPAEKQHSWEACPKMTFLI